MFFQSTLMKHITTVKDYQLSFYKPLLTGGPRGVPASVPGHLATIGPTHWWCAYGASLQADMVAPSDTVHR